MGELAVPEVGAVGQERPAPGLRRGKAEALEHRRDQAEPSSGDPFDQPSMFRWPHGPGWALVGDAGVVMDSVSVQGMTNALRDASLLSGAVVAGLGGSRPLADALREHQRRRDRTVRGVYDFTLGLAAFRPVRLAQRMFLAAVAADQQETDRFLSAFTGIVPPEQYFTLGTAVRLLGARRIRKLMRTGAPSSVRLEPRPGVPPH